MFSELIIAEIGEDRLNDVELVSLAGELASAGVDTTRSKQPLILYELLRHPDQLAKLVANPDLASGAVEEGMRFAPLPWCLPHRALRDVTHKGLQIRKGDLAMVMVPAANRDPAVFDRPNQFDIERPRHHNFGFGYGMRACPGAHLARMEMTIALREFTRRVEVVKLTEEPVQKGRNTDQNVDRNPQTIRRLMVLPPLIQREMRALTRQATVCVCNFLNRLGNWFGVAIRLSRGSRHWPHREVLSCKLPQVADFRICS